MELEPDTQINQPSSTCWRCHSCTFVNAIQSDVCSVCGILGLSSAGSVVVCGRSSMTVIPTGSFANIVDKDKAISPQLHPTRQTSADAADADVNNNTAITADDGNWACVHCTFRNSIDRIDCEICLKSRWNDRRLFSELLSHLHEYGAIACSTADIDCPICLDSFAPGDAMVLSECLHVFCFACLAQTVRYSADALVRCPFVCSSPAPDGQTTTATLTACVGSISDSEIRALLVQPGEYDLHMALSLRLAEAREKDSFHCKTPNCSGWCINEGGGAGNGDLDFHCSVCLAVNCLRCDVRTPQNMRR